MTEHRHPQPLAGKVALVTGGSRGLGAAIALRLAAHGAKVALTYHESPGRAADVVHTIEAGGGHAVTIRADAADADAVQEAVGMTVVTFGALDVLVNNAGVNVGAPITDITPAVLDRIIAVNVRAVFLAAQEAVRHMHDGGRIINIGSCNSERVTFAGGAAYAMTKGAVAGLTRALARELGPRGITVNNVEPGPTDTDMNPADGAHAAELRRHVALERYARPGEIASLVAFLAGPEASFVTGANLLVDGGYAA